MYKTHILFTISIIISLSTNVRCYPEVAKSLANNENSQDQTMNLLMNFIRTCFSDDLDMIVLAGINNGNNWIKFFNLPTYQLSLSKTNVFKRHSRLHGVYTLDMNLTYMSRYPAKIYIVQVPSSDYQMLLKRLRKSILWNARAYFILINENLNNICLKLRDVFLLLWESFNILNAFYVCKNDVGLLSVYTFNPYERVHSRFWMSFGVENIYTSKNYTMKYFKFIKYLEEINSSICQHLTLSNIEKIRTLDGYPIHLSAQIRPIMIDFKNQTFDKSESSALNSFVGYEVSLAQIIWTKLKTKATLSIHDFGGYVSRENKVYGIIALIVNHTYDMTLNERYMRAFWRLQTYPHDIAGLCALTRKIIIDSEIRVSQTISKPSVVIVIGLTCCINTIFLMYILKTDYALASINVLQALLGMSIAAQPLVPIKRFMFICIVVFYFIVNVYFNSQLTSTFTIPVEDTNINTLRDLIHSNYSVLGDKSVTEFLPDNLLGRFVESTVEDCLRLAPKENVACICDCSYSVNYALQNFTTHVSQSLYDTPLVFMVDEDWPLLNRVNFIIQTMRESGIVSYEYFKASYNNEYHRKTSETTYNEMDNGSKKSLRFQDLTYSILICAIGFLIALGVCIIENVAKLREQSRKRQNYAKN